MTIPSTPAPTPRTTLALAFVLLAAPLAAPLAAQGLHIGPETPTTPVEPGPTPRRPTLVRPIHQGLFIKSLNIQTRIVDGIATTTLAQTFHNPGARIAEGTWILPLPPGATADNFTMTMNGRQVSGEVLDAGKARRVYEDIVRRQRDPGLLEYMGNGCLRARVFPIPARADMLVEVRYRQVLPETAGVHEWTFPLRAAHVGGQPAQHVSLDLQIDSQKAIKSVYSPTSEVDIVRKGDHRARASFELKGAQMARRDLQVFYGLSDQEFGLTLLTHRKQGRDGYFMMLLAPKMSWDESKAMPKCINFVVDTSGSMNGQKIAQARGALKFFLNSLKPHDYFNVIPFSTEAQPFTAQPVMATPANIEKALGRVDEIEARGGTNIEQALTSALQAEPPSADIALVHMTVFLTDGLPTVQTTDPDRLLAIVRQANTHKHRIFVFGVGHDVNTRLLDKIAAESQGARDYVREEESIEVKTGALFTKLSHPVMSGVKIDCAGIEGFDVFPKTTPDLFKGSRLLLTGRYRGTGNHAIRLSGQVGGEQKTYVYEGTFPTERQDNDFIAALWAQRKVAVLLDAIRLNGNNPELVQEIRRLGAEHGIVTPYTSHLILEEGQRVAQVRFGRRGGFGVVADPAAPGDGAPATNRERLRRDLLRAGDAKADEVDRTVETLGGKLAKQQKEAKKSLDDFEAEKGKAAVRRSTALNLLAQSGSVDARGGGAAGLVSRSIHGRTFHLVEGLWVDGGFTAAMKDGVREIKAFSDEYFELLRKHAGLAKVLAFSTRMLVVVDGGAVEIVE